MSQWKAVSKETLSKAKAGQLGALERLDEVAMSGFITTDVLDAIFPHLVWEPEAFPSSSNRRYYALPPTAGARPSVCLRILWQAVDTSHTNEKVKKALLEHLRGQLNGVCNWIRFCLPLRRYRSIPTDMLKGKPSSTREVYITQARLLLQLFDLDLDWRVQLTSSEGFIDLLIDIFIAQDGDKTVPADNPRCFMESGEPAVCSIVDLAHLVLCDSGARSVFLQRVALKKNHAHVCFGISNRLSGKCHAQATQRNPSGILISVERLLGVSYDLCSSSFEFQKELARWDHLSDFSFILDILTSFMALPESGGSQYLTSQIPLIDRLCGMVREEPSRLRQVRAWCDLLSGEFIRLFIRVTTPLAKHDDERWLRNLEGLEACMAYPDILKRSPRMTASEFSPSELGENPIVIEMWSRFWISLDWAQRAQECTKGEAFQSTSDDYQLCASSEGQSSGIAKQCSGCTSVVYCSEECQVNDWNEFHRLECRRARTLQSRRRASRCQYTHASRAFQKTLLEVVCAARSTTVSHASRHVMPVLDLRSMAKMDTKRYIHDLAQSGYWDRSSGPDKFPDQDYLRPRLASLVERYSLRGLPSDWRLVEAVFPRLGDESGIYLTVLLRFVGGKFKGTYSVARYGYSSV
ncbi:hypothetical protein NMY22_g1494 [Coprinellus aureogranulatus]|nr:hypothetical protein NMY22_g1494 [Coprinellus aureogranulatus]